MKIGTKKRICVAVAWLAFLLMLAVVDGMDRFVIPTGRGALLMAVLTSVWAFGLWKAGWIKWRS